MLPYQDATLDIEKRLDDLMRRMTLEEMILQMDQYASRGFEVLDEDGHVQGIDEGKLSDIFGDKSVGSIQPRYLRASMINALQRYAVEKTRLGIPFLFSEEALHGMNAAEGTCFPQQIGLAATYDPELGRKMGRAIAVENRARGIGETFSPVMDLARDPRYGRTEETYGEDTFLSSEFARAVVRGLQGEDLRAVDSVAAEPKHFAAYGSPVGGLNCAPCAMNRHEVYSDCLPVFEAAFKDAGAVNAMCSYSAVDNTPVAMDRELLTQVLRNEWGMPGFVRSDMTAVVRLNDWFFVAETRKDAMKMGLEAGVDLQLFDYPHAEWLQGLTELVEEGKMDRSVIEQAARRVLRVKMMLGLFENPYVDETREEKLLRCEEHLALAQEIAEKSICLLKNQGNLLPLSPDIGTLALIGPCAGESMLGDYVPGGKTGVTLLQGVQKLVSPGTRIVHERGCGFLGDTAMPFPRGMLLDEEGHEGLTGRYYNSPFPEGEPVLVRTDRQIHFNWIYGKPHPAVSAGTFSVCWTGKMIPAETFDGCIGFSSQDSMRLYVDGQLILDGWGPYQDANRLVDFRFEAGRSYDIRVEFVNDQRAARVIFGYSRGRENFDRAVEAARQADVAIVCVGDSPETSGENFDRISLDLPGKQLELVKAVYATGTPVVLLMQSGRPVSCTWEHQHIPAILQCFFPGEMGGHAMARVLFGQTGPSGRLPVSFPQHVGQVPCHYSRRPGGGRRYVEMTWHPLYPFGYGLAYTDFEYRKLELDQSVIAPGDSVTARVTIANTGTRDGVCVPQLYLRDWVSSVVKAEWTLAAFARVMLKAGEEKTVDMVIRPREMRTLGRDYVWRIEPGEFSVYLSSSAHHLHQEAKFRVE